MDVFRFVVNLSQFQAFTFQQAVIQLCVGRSQALHHIQHIGIVFTQDANGDAVGTKSAYQAIRFAKAFFYFSHVRNINRLAVPDSQ